MVRRGTSDAAWTVNMFTKLELYHQLMVNAVCLLIRRYDKRKKIWKQTRSAFACAEWRTKAAVRWKGETEPSMRNTHIVKVIPIECSGIITYKHKAQHIPYGRWFKLEFFEKPFGLQSTDYQFECFWLLPMPHASQMNWNLFIYAEFVNMKFVVMHSGRMRFSFTFRGKNALYFIRGWAIDRVHRTSLNALHAIRRSASRLFGRQTGVLAMLWHLHNTKRIVDKPLLLCDKCASLCRNSEMRDACTLLCMTTRTTCNKMCN